jgi:hypothetical protein
MTNLSLRRAVTWMIYCSLTLATYRGSGQPAPNVSLNAVVDSAMTFAYYPSLRKVEVDVRGISDKLIAENTLVHAGIGLEGSTTFLAEKSFSLGSKGTSAFIDLPMLKDGMYELRVRVPGEDRDIVRSFKHINFPWLGNTIGITDKVYAPFTPIRISGKDVQVVLRSYRMNGFGLWDRIQSEEKDLLSGPVVLHALTGNGVESSWKFVRGEWVSQAGNKAVYQAVAESPAVHIETTSTIEYDGMMKVEMQLSPGKGGVSIQRLWLDIPIKKDEGYLFHYSMAPEIRRNYSGAIPHGGKITWMKHPDDTQDPPVYYRGGTNAPIWKAEPGPEDGVVWTNRDMKPWEHVWKTDFVPYIWLGGPTRGIAWFGASPRGYKVDSKGVMQRIVRDGATVSLQVDLINQPGKLTGTRSIIFGMQASPTKPMPKDWRSQVAIPGIDVAVHCAPWGAHGCSDKYPDDQDFRVVDEIMNVRKTGVLNPDVFIELDNDRSAHFKSMTNHQDTTWLAWVMSLAKVNQAVTVEADQARKGYVEGALLVPYRYHVDGGKHEVNYIWRDAPKDPMYPEWVVKQVRNAPLAMYFEEHASTVVNNEWVVYQDEWRGRRIHKKRSEYVAEPQMSINNFSVGRQGFPPSYRDFALWYANEWMKRGVSLYFDNTYLHMEDNPLTSEAYIDDEGDPQPAARLWDMREYHKRMWQLAQEWNARKPAYPIMLVHHMSNSMMLPIHTWNDSMLDIEYPYRSRVPDPFPAEYLLAQATGHQTGSYRHLLESVQRLRSGIFRESVSDMDPNLVRTEWGMRMVHEAMRWLFPNENFAAFEPGRMLEKALWDFGYGTDDCKVVNYWSDDVPVKVSDPDAKWLLMERPKDKTLFLVLQSYKNEDMPLEITLDSRKIGFTPASKARDVESGSQVKVAGSKNELKIETTLRGRFGTQVLIIGSGS